MIISELQGGENDPEQLLDTEVTADGVQGASVSPSDDRLAVGSADDDARRPVRPLPALLRAVERHAGDRRRRRHRRRAEAASRSISAAFPPGARPARVQAGRAASSRPSAGWCCARRARPRIGRRRSTRRRSTTTAFFPLLVADAVLNGAAGLNIWSGGGVSRPQRSARLYRALVDKRAGLDRQRRADADRSIRISTGIYARRRRRADAGGGRGGRAGARSIGSARGRHHARRARRRCTPSCARASSTTATA